MTNHSYQVAKHMILVVMHVICREQQEHLSA